ncbi:protein of unknown function [Hyphomicrobium sp. MC1]|nr:protein of unknown function [Hyphomicrobium sp. MC1]
MENFKYRFHLRLDEPTGRALHQISRSTIAPKSTLMRRYVQEGVARDIKLLADKIGGIVRSSELVGAFEPPQPKSSR